jgi:hypothetical protein
LMIQYSLPLYSSYYSNHILPWITPYSLLLSAGWSDDPVFTPTLLLILQQPHTPMDYSLLTATFCRLE